MHTSDLSHDLASACLPASARLRAEEEPTGAFAPASPAASPAASPGAAPGASSGHEEQSSGSLGVASLWACESEADVASFEEEEEPWLLPEDEDTDEVLAAAGPASSPREELTCDLDTRALQRTAPAPDSTLDDLLDLPAWALDPL